MWIAVVVAILFALPAAADFVVPQSVIGAGGGAMSGASNTIIGTVGQSAIGVTSGPSNIHEIGFWYQPGWILTGVGDEMFPTEYWLGEGYPNPFNPRARRSTPGSSSSCSTTSPSPARRRVPSRFAGPPPSTR